MQKGFFDWVWRLLEEYGGMFLSGAGVTLLIALGGTIVGFIIGLLVGMLRTVPRKGKGPVKRALLSVAQWLASAYIEVFRSTPMIVQAMVIFYGAAQLWNIHMDNILAGFVVVSINTGAYMAEIVRGGIQSVDVGQREAAQAIGMTHSQAMLNVILPQAIRNILPSIGNEFVVNIKDTSVLNVISVTELYFTAKSAAGAYYRYFEAFFITSVIYFVMTFTVTRLLRLLEHKLDGPKAYRIHGSQSFSAAEIKVGGDRVGE